MLNRKILTILMSILIAPVLAHGASVTVTVDPRPGAQIPDDFTGLSFEIQLLLPQKDGSYYFSPDNKRLIDTMKVLGVKNIRVGGNTSDNPAVAIPNEKDIDNFFAFAKAADVKVIYTLRLKGVTDYTDAARITKYVMSKYGSQVQCFALGNEPNVYLKTYPEFRNALTKFITAVTAPDVAPDAVFCGPSSTPGKGLWAHDLAADLGKGGKLKLITQHSYPGSSARRVNDVAAARDKMLSTDWVAGYAKMHDAIMPAVEQNGLSLRLEECNSFFHGGAKDVSDTFASSLWALDFMHWWASHGCVGLNFHTGDNVAANDQMAVCRYAIYLTEKDGYSVRPIGYALKAFEMGGRGRVVPVKVASEDPSMNLTAYGVLAADKSLYMTLINKTHGDGGKPASVTLDLEGYARAESMILAVRGSEIAATTGVTLGGAPIGDDASWKGGWMPLSDPAKPGPFQVEVPAATATVVRLIRP